MKVDILFTAKNRVEYTRESLRQLIANTNWDLVNGIILINDNDPSNVEELANVMVPAVKEIAKYTRTQYLSTAIHTYPFNIRRRTYQDAGYTGNPVALMNLYLSQQYWGGAGFNAPWFAKIDNDTVVPPGWLDACVSIAETDKVDLIGIECREGYTRHPPMTPYKPELSFDELTTTCGGLQPYPVIRYRSTDHIGGIGLFQRSVFLSHPLPKPTGTYYGFTEWQWQYPDVRKCWIDPPLPVVLLDHVPVEPWMGLGAEYVRQGYQRESWGYYTDRRVFEWWLATSDGWGESRNSFTPA